MLCLLTGSSRTVDRCEVCWTIFADQWTVVLYLVIKTGLGSVRETGKYSNLDLNWPSPPILLKLRIFLMETPKRVSDNQWRSADGQEVSGRIHGASQVVLGILSAAFSQHHLLGFEIAQLEFHHLH